MCKLKGVMLKNKLQIGFNLSLHNGLTGQYIIRMMKGWTVVNKDNMKPGNLGSCYSTGIAVNLNIVAYQVYPLLQTVFYGNSDFFQHKKCLLTKRQVQSS